MTRVWQDTLLSPYKANNRMCSRSNPRDPSYNMVK